MRLQIHPSEGIGDLRFGMTFRDAVLVAAQYGEPRVRPGAPAALGPPALPARSPTACVDVGGFALRLGSEDWVHLTYLEVWAPGHDFGRDSGRDSGRHPSENAGREDAGAVFEYEGTDVFGTPVREWAASLRTRGRNVLWEEEAEKVLDAAGPVFLIPEETLLVSRETGRAVERDPRDGLPLYPVHILVGPANYYARADAWLRGEALYADEA